MRVVKRGAGSVYKTFTNFSLLWPWCNKQCQLRLRGWVIEGSHTRGEGKVSPMMETAGPSCVGEDK